jgi:mannose-1-phosphate guanylyltransferase / mannose-6-phosphate isomerase
MILIPTILCGGAGSRLWPISRETHPKPFIRLADNQSLVQKAFLRGAILTGVKEILTVTNRELFFKMEDEFEEVNHRQLPISFILEPFGRNTAPAIAAAALRVAAQYGDDALLLVLAADHLISDQAAFEAAVAQAAQIAQTGKLVTFGIRPDAPETGYGYIEANGNEVLRFVEKPSLDNAREYLSSGRFLWNSGMFCFSASSLIEQMRQHCPDILTATQNCLDHSRQIAGEGFSEVELNAERFKLVPDDSIDYAVMEKSDRVAVVPCDIGWSDIGSWTALGDIDAPDALGNRIQGQDVYVHNAHSCTIQSNHRLVAAVGVKDLVIVETADAVLVADKAEAQNVKHIYAELKQKNHDAYRQHPTVHRPWGAYTVLEEGENFKIKRIEVKPGGRLSLQMHRHRSEHWVVLSGIAKVTNADRVMELRANESTYIPVGHRHRLENPSQDWLVIIEVQCGSYVGEDDIVRFDDTYGRCDA